MEINTLGFENLELSFEDESAVLYGNRTVEILENSLKFFILQCDFFKTFYFFFYINDYIN